MSILAAFNFGFLLMAVVWGTWVLLNLWIWQKSKAQSSLLMLVGSGILTLYAVLWAFTEWPSEFQVMWLPLIGTCVLTVGFYLSVKPLVEAHVAALQAKLRHATQEKKP